MSEEKKVIKQEEKNPNVQPLVYVKAADVTTEDLKKMDTCIVTLRDTFDKKKNSHRYSLIFRFNNGMEINKYISKNEYMIVSLKRKLDQKITVHDFVTACRFVKGNYDTATDDYWIRVDVFIVGGYTISEFLNGNDKYCVKVLGKDLGYILIDSPEIFDTKTVEYKEEIFDISE